MKLKSYLTEDLKKSMTADIQRNFDQALKAFLKGAQQIIDDHYKKDLPNLKPSILVTTSGKKYVKVISKAQSGTSTSAWAFIDKTTGDVLKPATWSRPAKHARGNIYDQDNGTRSVSPYGPAYLR